MTEDVLVPKWGLTTDEFVLISWLVAVGDEVTEGQALAELEADKAEGELESPVAGTVAELLASPSDTVEPGDVIARITTS